MRKSWGIEEGYFVSTKVGNLPVTFLVDTGSNVSILRKGLLEQFSPQTGLSVQPTNIKLVTVTEEVTPFHGKTVLEVEIGSQKISHQMLIADIENDGILGMDFLTAHNCDLMLSQQSMKLNGEKIRCFPNSRNVKGACCRVAILEHVEIPPETEMVVAGFTTDVIDMRSTGVVEVDTKFLHKRGLLVAKA